MITLLHGDHTLASRNELNRLKDAASNKEIRVLDGRALELSTLVQSLESSSLFGGDTLVIIERLFGKIGKFPKRIAELCTILIRSSEATDIILWEDKEVGVTVTKNLGSNAKIQLFKLTVIIFEFLDSLIPGNSKQLMEIYSRLIIEEAPELVFAMMVKRVRQLIQLADGVTPTGVAGWQASRLTTQAQSFTMEKLLGMYKTLYDRELSIKTGTSPFSISSHIEQFIIQI